MGMEIPKSYKIGLYWFILVLIFVLSYALVYAVKVDTTKPWHVLSQIARSYDDLTSIDSNGDGRIDVGLTEETLQSITNNGATTSHMITVGGINSEGDVNVITRLCLYNSDKHAYECISKWDDLLDILFAQRG